MLLEDPQLNELFMRGRDSLVALKDDDEFQRFSNMCLKAFWFGSSAHFQLRQGTLAEEDWYELKAILDFWLQGPGVRAWWQRFGHDRYGPIFSQFVDELAAHWEALQTTKPNPA
jgi:hypothetical protein